MAAKVADCAISSESPCSRHHVEQKTDESTRHPQCALRTVPGCSSVFSSSLPAAVVPHAFPPPCNAWGLGGVTNQYVSGGAPTNFVGIPGAIQAVAVPSMVPPFLTIPLPVPLPAILMFKTPPVAAPVL